MSPTANRSHLIYFLLHIIIHCGMTVLSCAEDGSITISIQANMSFSMRGETDSSLCDTVCFSVMNTMMISGVPIISTQLAVVVLSCLHGHIQTVPHNFLPLEGSDRSRHSLLHSQLSALTRHNANNLGVFP